MGRSRRKPVRKRIEVVPEVKGQAPSRVSDSNDPKPVPLDLLPPLTPAGRATLVDVLADIAHGQLEERAR